MKQVGTYRKVDIQTFILTFALALLLTTSFSNGEKSHASSAHHLKRAINSNGNWAFACDLAGNDMANVQICVEDCGGRCAQTPGCTRFTWTRHKSGIYWMKSGSVSKNDAFSTNDDSMVCGVLDNPSPTSPPTSGLGPKLYGVLATRHGAYEAGACALPAASYAVTNPVALGSIDSLSHLKFKPELYGQVLRR